MSYFDDYEDDYMRNIASKEDSVGRPKKKSNKKAFSRGYSMSRERLRKGCALSMSCFNCEYYYQSVGDKEEACQCREVLEYDMVVDGHRVYCTHWQMCDSNNESSTLFKKRGRRMLD